MMGCGDSQRGGMLNGWWKKRGRFVWMENGEEGLNKWKVSQKKLESKNRFEAARVRQLIFPIKIPIFVAFNFIVPIIVPVESFRGSWLFFSLLKLSRFLRLSFTLSWQMFWGIEVAVRTFIFQTELLSMCWIGSTELAQFVLGRWPFGVHSELLRWWRGLGLLNMKRIAKGKEGECRRLRSNYREARRDWDNGMSQT